jgi:hypothetical protein
MYDEMKSALDSFKGGEALSEELINLGAYFDEWMRYNRMLVDQITSHQRASSSITSGLVLSEGNVLVSDMCMVFENRESESLESGDDMMSTYIAVVHKTNPRQGSIFGQCTQQLTLTFLTVNILQIPHKTDFEDFSPAQDAVSRSLLLPQGVSVHDMKFVDDEALVLLVKDNGKEIFVYL